MLVLTIVLKYHRTSAAQATTELNILESRRPCFYSVSNVIPTVPKFTVRSAVSAKPPIIENNAQIFKRLCHDHEPWTSGNWISIHDIVWWDFTVPLIRNSLCLEISQLLAHVRHTFYMELPLIRQLVKMQYTEIQYVLKWAAESVN
jgi:hypothetical protein